MSLQTNQDLFPERNPLALILHLKRIVQNAQDLAVNNEPAFKKITSLYSESKDWEKQVEFARKTANAPDQDRINARNDKAKEILAPLKEIQSIAKTKSAQYQAMIEAEKKMEEQRIQEAIAILDLQEAPYIPPADKTLRGDGAIVYTRTVRKFRIVDESKVPDQYFTLDEKLIENAVKMGVAEIAGVEIYEEKISQIKTR